MTCAGERCDVAIEVSNNVTDDTVEENGSANSFAVTVN